MGKGGVTGTASVADVGGAGMSGSGEAGSASSSAGGVESGEAADGIVRTGGDVGAFDGGIAGQHKGERSKSLSSSKKFHHIAPFSGSFGR